MQLRHRERMKNEEREQKKNKRKNERGIHTRK
jgi:hypothetical protein